MEKLRELRKAHNMTTFELGKAVGVANQTITRYELDDRKPTPDMLIRFADFFGVSVDYLLGRDEQKSPATLESYGVSDSQTRELIKLFGYMNTVQRAQVYGYAVGLLEQAGVNVQAALNG